MPSRRLPETIIAALLLVAGSVAAVSEARALVFGRAAIASPGDFTPHPGLATDSRFHALMLCDRAMAEPGFSLQSELSRRQTAGRCADLAEFVCRDAPSHGFAHLVAATAARALGQPDRMVEHLAASQALARREGWQAERRFLLLSTADPAHLGQLLSHDISVMLTTQNGAVLLARAMTGPSPLRDHILAEADTASPADRQRLLNLVKKMSAGT